MAAVIDCWWKNAAGRLEAVERPRVKDVIRTDGKCGQGWTWGENETHLHLRTGDWTDRKGMSGSMRSNVGVYDKLRYCDGVSR